MIKRALFSESWQICFLALIGIIIFALSNWGGIPQYALRFCTQMFITVIIFSSFRVLVGMAGVITFGHALYVGMGAYGAAHFMLWAEQANVGVPLIIVPLVGGVAGLLAALVAGWLCTRRTRMMYVSMMTLALSELVHVLAQVWSSVFGGEGGIQIDRTMGNFMGVDFADDHWLMLLALFYAVLCLLLVSLLSKSTLGQWLVASRTDALRVACLGVKPQRVQYMAFLISGFLAGIGGGLLALEFEIVDSSMFSINSSGSYLIFSALGGLGSFMGSIVSAILYVFAQIGLPLFTSIPELWIGLAVIVMVLFFPQGLCDVFKGFWGKLKTHPHEEKS